MPPCAVPHITARSGRRRPPCPEVLLTGLSMDSAQDGWATGATESASTQLTGRSSQEFFYHYSQGRWELTPLTLPSIGGATVAPFFVKPAMVSPGNGWMLGATTATDPSGWVLHFTQGRLQTATLPMLTAPKGWVLYGIDFQPDGSGWIFGTESKTMTPKGKEPYVTWVPLVLRYSGGAWRIELH